ncbi:sushi domain-containing protein 2-like [Asterias rubens]|uniref:sushi domain-containing protein 2-like n=1 Tax=Asterias rubens TaxID=7604 RepID=UPI001455B8FB|nr:sushi domain-containing protein 2-like [Asterias rubens]
MAAYLLHPAGLMLLFLTVVSLVTAQEQGLFFPYGREAGDSNLEPEDDGGEEVVISIDFPFFDQNHRSLYVNTNGVVSFLQNVVQYTPDSFPLGNDRRMIAPFWADVDTTTNGTVWYRETTDFNLLREATDEVGRVFAVDFKFNPFRAEWMLIATWDRVPFYNAHGANVITNRQNTFQAVLVTDGKYSFTFFNYGEIQWTTGVSSYGDKVTGLGGDNELAVPAQVGFNAGDARNFYSVPSSQTDDIVQINRTTNVRKPGRWMFRIDGNEIEVAGCEDDQSGNLRVSPSQVLMLGGDVLSISGPCFDATSDVFCEINGYKIQASYDFVQDPFTVRCATPLFTSLGEVPVHLSKDGGVNFNYTGYVTVVSMNRVAPKVTSTETNGVLRISWDRDGYPFTTNTINADQIRVDVFLYEYTEDATTGQILLKPVLKIVDDVKLSNGFGSLLTPQLDEQIDVGLYRVVLHGTVDVNDPGISLTMGIPGTDPSQAPMPSMWSIPFNGNPPLASESTQWCQKWAAKEPSINTTGDSLPACPCTLQQARADVGAFEPDPWCNQDSEAEDKCPHRNEVVHCVRAQRSSTQGRGQLCCYDNTNNIVLLADNFEGGSTLSHFHGGATPAGHPGSIPYLSNYLEDRVPWEQCCPGSGYLEGVCSLYRDRRPSNDCKDYLPPKPAAVFGEPHFITFDGTKYTFNGYGEFMLMTAPESNVFIHGRMAQMIDNVKATGLTAVTMKVGESDTVQVELNDRRTLDVWVRSEDRETWQRLGFEQSSWWIDKTDGPIVELIGADERQGVRVIFNDGTAFEAKAPAGGSAMALMILASSSLKDQTRGLLGRWNDDPSDDLTAPNGIILPRDPLTQLHDFFGLKWILEGADRLFRDDISINYTLVNQPTFQASYDLVSTLTEEELNTVCGDSEVCRYDYKKTSSSDMGDAARDVEEDYEDTNESTKPVASCGYLSPPSGGSKLGTVYLNQSTVTFNCSEGFTMTGSASRKCIDRVWQGNVTLCTAVASPLRDLLIIIIVAAVLAGLLLIGICFICLLCCISSRKKKKNRKEKHSGLELGTLPENGGIHNHALVTTPLASDRTPSDTPTSSIIGDHNYENSMQRNHHSRDDPQTAFRFPDTNGYAVMTGDRHPTSTSEAARHHRAAPLEDRPVYRVSATESRGPGYRIAEEARAGPSHAAGTSAGSSRPIPNRDPSRSKQPKVRAEENTYDDPRAVRQRDRSRKNGKGSIIKDPNTAHFDAEYDSSDDEIARIKRQLRREVEEEDDEE